MDLQIKAVGVTVTPALRTNLRNGLTGVFGQLPQGTEVRVKISRSKKDIRGRRFKVVLKVHSDEAGSRAKSRSDFLYEAIYRAILELERLSKVRY